MYKVVIILVAILIAIMAFFYFGTYSEGVRAGTLIKVSKRGTIFKTYEGQLNVNAFGAVTKGTLDESFEFSIPNDPDLVKKMEELTGFDVQLFYKEKYFVFPWLGETKYMVSDVKANNDAPTSDQRYPGRN